MVFVPNEFLDRITSLAQPETALAFSLYRIAADSTDEWILPNEADSARLSGNALLEAQKGLIEKGIVEVSRSSDGQTSYRFLGKYKVGESPFKSKTFPGAAG